jgi:hypothetical protein
MPAEIEAARDHRAVPVCSFPKVFWWWRGYLPDVIWIGRKPYLSM